ncbi:VPA1269 family protein [Bosea sp. ANAM02]|uniref:VPA1269 family protein n=1 Tax=Bosea sp. ANAM02 TaxID=2020412 RepID=UPI00140EAB70|nr:VPA1269 family protein [Bosea sp. ANAM02]BCB22453.1 hypothetical protein OCUBac02_53470 [Bosea sp. ANAM02]
MLDRVVPKTPELGLATPIGNGWFNPLTDNFAILPEDWEEASHDVDEEDQLARFTGAITTEGYLLEAFQLIASESKTHGEKIDALKPLFEFWEQKAALFPFGFIWGQSALGTLSAQLLHEIAARTGELQDEAKASIERLPFIARKTGRDRDNHIGAIYRVVLAFQLASTNVRTIDDVQREHLLMLADMVRPAGVWAPWLSQWHKTVIRGVAKALSEQREDPGLGQSFLRVGERKRPKRKSDTAIGAPHLLWVDELFERFLDSQKFLQKKQHRRALDLLLLGFKACPPEDVAEVATAFRRSNMQALMAAAKDWSTPDQRLQCLSKIFDFCVWVQDESRDEDGHPQIALGLTNADIDRFRQSLPAASRSSDSEVRARPMPARLHVEMKNLIRENDFAWPKSLLKKDRPSEWITHIDPVTGEGQEVFCEVLPRLLLLMLDLPLRSVQARRLDSGEGDDEAWSPASRQWVENPGPAAGYWRKMGARNRRRGVLRRIPSAGRNGGSITGFYVNSNKTQDRNKEFDEMSGYEIPWEFLDVIENLAAMRAWQERYNPVERPLSSSDTPVGLRSDEASESVAGNLPDRFYLFRYPLNAGYRGNEAPPNYQALHLFFNLALEELERRLNLEDPENPIKIITRREPGGSPRQAIYTLHGLRSSTITTLYSEGVPITILSKLVAGHATILMTLSYVKFDPLHVSEVLSAAREKALANDTSQFRSTLLNTTYEEAAKMTARLQDDGLQQAKGLYADANSWSSPDIGICPNGGVQCHIGGEPQIRKGGKSHRKPGGYLPVPGGPRNCVRCRFFITGLPFLIPLAGHANMQSAKASSLSIRIEQSRARLKDLKRERHELSTAGHVIPSGLRKRIMAIEAELEADSDARDQVFTDFHATLTLVEKIRAISRQDAGDKLPMLINDDGIPELTGRESTRFELTDSVVQMSRFYPSLESADLERERDQFLDRILYNGGYIPITLGPLSAEERRKAADAMSAFLLTKLGASESQNLIEGHKTLADLGLQQPLEDVVRRAIGAPLVRLETRPQPGAVLELTASETEQ